MSLFVHPSSCIDEGAQIGAGTRIWHFCHVAGSARIGRDCSLGQNVYVGDGVVAFFPAIAFDSESAAVRACIESAHAIRAVTHTVAERCNLHRPVVEQPVYNLFERHRFGEGYRHVYEDHGYGSTTWSPLASGTLTGKYQKGVPEGSRGSLESLAWLRGQITDPERLARVAALQPLAEQMGATLAQFSIAWCLQNPWVSTVITGASRVEQVHENMKAVEVAERFTPDLLAAIDEIFT